MNKENSPIKSTARRIRRRPAMFALSLLLSLAVILPATPARAAACVMTPDGNDDIILTETCTIAAGTYGSGSTVRDFIVNGGITVTAAGDTGGGTGVIILAYRDITISGTLTADVQGYAHSQGPGQGLNTSGAGGAGHGGDGGDGQYQAGGGSYGSVTGPVTLGSGGGDRDGSSFGGAGGGAIKLVATGSLTLTGAISADGGNGNSRSGGGSGGSIWIDAGTIAGSGGTVGANGGNGWNGEGYGGGGGGGRISIEYATDSSSWTTQAVGGNGYVSAQDGGAGTVFARQGSTDGTLTVRNNNLDNPANTTQVSGFDLSLDGMTVADGAKYALPGSSTDITLSSGATLTGGGTVTPSLTVSSGSTFDTGSASFTFPEINFNNSGDVATVTDLTKSGGGAFTHSGTFSAGVTDVDVQGGTVVAAATNLTNLDTLTVRSGGTFQVQHTSTISATTVDIQSGGTLTHTANGTSKTSVIDISGTNITIAGTVSLDTRGYRHGSGPGAGGGGSGAGGGGHGGAGGNGQYYAGGGSYDSATEPVDLGSGGGDRNGADLGGAGGGAVKLTASNSLALTGSISADGGNGNSRSGGGAGGSVWIIAPTVTGSGSISADGGSGWNGTGYGGGGGGGLVYMLHATVPYQGSVTVAGGYGTPPAQSGAAGTFTEETGNAVPVANDDSGYSVSEGDTLTVNAASGVLDNDTDGDTDPLTATGLDQGSTEGSVVLNSDGSFEYTPPVNWGGVDTFTYYANDGTVDSATAATVSITVSTNDRTTVQYATVSRLSVGADADFDLEFTLSNTLTSDLTVTFPGSFTVNSAFTSGTCSGGGTIGTFTYDATHLYAEKDGCSGTVSLSGASVTLPSTAGLYTVTWTNDDPGETVIPVTDDDVVSVYGNVDPTLTFDIDIGKVTGDDTSQPYAIDFGQIDFASPEASDNSVLDSIWLDFETNATGGGVITVRSANAAMVSTSSSDQWSSATASLAANTEAYGVCVDTTIAGTPRSGHPGGTAWAAASPYDTSCTAGATMSVGALQTSNQTIMSSAGPLDAGRVQVRVGMSVASSTPAHPDYQDVLTFIATATY